MPQKEFERLQAVSRFLKLEISKEKELQAIVDLAAEICQTKTALITLIDEDSQYVKFKFGSDLEKTRREDAFCSHTIETDGLLIVRDALLDERFVHNPLVTGDPNIRFYAGAPLTTGDGYKLGSLCVIDDQPHELTAIQLRMLEALSGQVIRLIEFDATLKILKDQFLQVKSSEVKLRSFFESSSSCHLLVGINLEVLAFNKAVADFIKKVYQIDVAIGMHAGKFTAAAHTSLIVDNCQRALKGEHLRIETELEYEHLPPVTWYITFEPAPDMQGGILGVSINATDITARRAQEKQVLAQNESLKKIAQIQSHELRRPVSSIIGLMNLFREDNYQTTKEELLMLEKAIHELDDKIRTIVRHTA